MTTNIKTNVEIEKNVEALLSAILQAKKDFARAWVTLASNLNNLKLQMEELGDRTLNWQTYVGVESFEEYCEQVLDIDHKTGYQLISSLKVLKVHRPELIDNAELPQLHWTKFRLLGTKKAELLSKRNPRDYQQLVDKFFDKKNSRRKLESDFEYYFNKNSETPIVEEPDPDPVLIKISSYLNNNKQKVSDAVKSGDIPSLNKVFAGLPGLNTGFSTRVENPGIKRIVICNSAKGSPYTDQVVDRAQKLDPSIEIVETGVTEKGNDIRRFPAQLQGAGYYWYMKETLYIRERGSSPFIETFPSPGDIVENLNTALKLGFHCRSTCHYCYQQVSQGIYQEIYSNLDRVKSGIVIEPFVHKATLAIWCLISHLKKETLNQITYDLDKSMSSFRSKAIKSGIDTDELMIQFLGDNVEERLKYCKIEYTQDDLDNQKVHLPEYYKQNQNTPLWVWVSEYHDILAIEPLAKQMEFILSELLPLSKDVNYMVATKTAHKECFEKYDGQNQVMLNMNLNPELVITKYETGTSSLADRLELIKYLQKKGGYQVRVSFEPMIYFDGWQESYKKLVATVADSINLSDIKEIVLGSIRLRTGLKNEIHRNYPTTDLFENDEILEKATSKDKRGRYKEIIRVEQYQTLIDELSEHTDAEIILGAEYPEMWDWVGLNKEKFMKNRVYQYTQPE